MDKASLGKRSDTIGPLFLICVQWPKKVSILPYLLKFVGTKPIPPAYQMKELLKLLETIQADVSEPFYKKWDFWISQVFGVVGLMLSWLAYKEASRAKEAAQAAANLVKNVTLVAELTEMVEKLKKLKENVQHTECRDMWNENTIKAKRLIFPYKTDEDLNQAVISVEDALLRIRKALDEVVPVNPENQRIANTVYLAVEAPFADLAGHIAELIGLFERKSTKVN